MQFYQYGMSLLIFPTIVTQHIFRRFEDHGGYLLYRLSFIIETLPLIIDIFTLIEEFASTEFFINEVSGHPLDDLIIIIYVILIPKIAISKRLKGLRVRNRKPLCSKEYAPIGTPIIAINAMYIALYLLNLSTC